MKSAGSIKIIIADDHILYLEGLRTVLKKHKDFEVIGEAHTGERAIELADKKQHDVLITDIFMPGINGIETAKYFQKHFPITNVIINSMSNDDYAIMDALDAGVKGFVVKNSSAQDIVDAVTAVGNNETFFCRSTEKKLRKILLSRTESGKFVFSKERFTANERKILQLLCNEYSSKEMASEMKLSIRTVESYRDTLFKKTNVKNMAGLVVFAMKHQLNH